MPSSSSSSSSTFHQDIHEIQTHAFNATMLLIWGLYIFAVLRISSSAPQYIGILQSFVKIYISLFLIYRFNPFRKIHFTQLDKKISFNAGVFLLGTTAVDTIARHYLTKIYPELVVH